MIYFPFPCDKYQLRVLKLLDESVGLIEGPPGTGKTETVVNIICHLVANGKKVLVVSQNSQALKVVKKKIKDLGIEKMFAFIPNPGSPQVNDDDMADGVAPALANLEAYADKLDEQRTIKKMRELDKILRDNTDKIDSLRNDWTCQIKNQQLYYLLDQERQKIKDFDIHISDVDEFKNNFIVNVYDEVKSIKNHVDKLTCKIEFYKKAEDKRSFNQIFGALDWRLKKHSEPLIQIKKYIGQHAYEGHNHVARIIKNSWNRLFLRDVRSALPKKILNHIDNELKKGGSRSRVVYEIEAVCDYALYKENKNALQISTEDIDKLLNRSGLKHHEFDRFDKLVAGSDFQTVKQNIIRYSEIEKELRRLPVSADSNMTAKRLRDEEKKRSKYTASYIQQLINYNILVKLKNNRKLRKEINRLAIDLKKSRKAFKTFTRLRNNAKSFEAILGLIPVWIMELEDASRILPLQAGLFDIVILDEASECNISYTLPSMFRAKQTLLVGDREQMRDNTILFKSNQFLYDLAQHHKVPEDLQIKPIGSSVRSILDIAKSQAFPSIPLRLHYRSPSELIGFSNQHFYKGKEMMPLNNNYCPYKDTNRIMLIHQVEPKECGQEIAGRKVNIAEADAILSFVQELRKDKSYKDKSIGILCFFNAQASYIREVFEASGLKSGEHNYQISTIDGIQGDEKDIVIYSFVITSKDQKIRYVPLSGEGGDIQQDVNSGRVNVAFSRARLQVHCFISIPVGNFPEKIWLKKFLEYVQKHGLIQNNNSELKEFVSPFEEEFYTHARKKLDQGYEVANQVTVCGLKLLFVVHNTKSGKKMAIEFYGPTSISDTIEDKYEEFVENDYERQAILRGAGFQIYGIKYSDWASQKLEWEKIINDIVALLT